MGSAFLDALLVTDPMFDCFVIILVKHAMGLHAGEKKKKIIFQNGRGFMGAARQRKTHLSFFIVFLGSQPPKFPCQ